MVLNTDTDKDLFLVYVDRYTPRWGFYLDSIKNKIYRTSGIFKGVVVPEGKHRLTFHYHDPVIKWEIVVYSISVVLGWIMLFILLHRGQFKISD